MPSFFNAKGDGLVSPLFGLNHLLGLTMSILIISTLFIFKKFYAKVSKDNSFRITLGVIQLVLYVLYFVFFQLTSNSFTWKDYMPFQLSSLLNLTSAFLLILPLEKLFSLTFTLIAPVILSFLVPDSSKWIYGPNNFFYYQYYFNHIIIFFGYFYLYLYGHVQYNKMFLKQAVANLIFFGTLVYLFNASFDTNYLFIGKPGYRSSFIDTGKWIPLLRFAFMFGIALCFLIPFHYFLVTWLKPYYLNKGSEINPYYKDKPAIFKKIKFKKKSNNFDKKQKVY